MHTGIYKITCTKSGKFYVGSSEALKRRKVYHFNRLRANKHCNPHMQNSYNLYGEETFVWEVVKKCPIEDLLREEQALIDLHWNDKILFNVAPIAGASFRNRHHSKETIAKMKANSARHWANHEMSPEHRKKISVERMKFIREHGLRKLTDEQVREIRQTYNPGQNSGIGVRTFAKKFGVSRRTVKHVLSGKRYFDVDVEEETK